MILLIIIPVYISLNLYILHRVHKWLTACSERFHSGKFAVPYIVIYSLLALSLLFAFLLPSSELQVLVKRISNYWLGTFAYILIFIAVADILRLVLKKIPGKIHDFFFSKVGYVFVGILLTALIGGISAYGIVHSNIVKVKPYEVTIRKNCGDNRDLKVVLVADLHLGYSVGNRQMQRMVKKINDQNADLVVFAGDIFDNEYDAIYEPDRVADLLAGLKSRYGTYACYGNHDIEEPVLAGFTFRQSEKKESDPRMDEFLKNANITLLRDEGTLIDGKFYLYGRPDAHRPGRGIETRKTPDEITADMDKNKPIIVLDHQPKELQELADAGVDVDLCGHTHDGQMFPGNLTIKLMWENACGYLQKGKMHNIVTSGVGLFGPNMRVGTKAEICPITIHFAKN